MFSKLPAGVIVNVVSTVRYLRIIRDLNEGRDLTTSLPPSVWPWLYPLHSWSSNGGLFVSHAVMVKLIRKQETCS